MLERPRAALTFANVTSLLALTVALGTGAYAANTIGSRDIVDGSIRSVDIHHGQVNAADLGPGAVRSGDVADGDLNASDVAEASGTLVWDPGETAEDACALTRIDTGVDIRGDTIAVSPTLVGFTETHWTTRGAREIELYVCNHYDGAIDPPSTTFAWVVFDT